MHARNRTWILLLWMALGTGPWTAAGADRPRDADRPKPETIPVRVVRLAARDIERTLEYVGDIKGQDEAMVYPKVSGKISEKLKEDGAKVRKGDVLATIDRDEVGLKFEKAPVESPLSGVVGRVYVDRGASVSPQTPVALVVNMDRVRVRLDVPEKYLPGISLDQSAELSVDAWAGQVFTGKVFKISPIVDLDTRTAPVEIRADNPERKLQPGMFSRVRLVLEKKKDVILVPREAVLGRAPETMIYVVEGGVARQRNVTTGIRDGGEVEIVRGAEAGEQVVVWGQQKLRDGAEVLVEGGEAPGGAAGQDRDIK
jgi:membrane fusion protein (multidrug efflux system)